MSTDTLELVIATIKATMETSSLPPCELTGATVILVDTPLDSIGLAQVVVTLEQKTGRDPFHDGFINFTTISELAKLYAE